MSKEIREEINNWKQLLIEGKKVDLSDENKRLLKIIRWNTQKQI